MSRSYAVCPNEVCSLISITQIRLVFWSADFVSSSSKLAICVSEEYLLQNYRIDLTNEETRERIADNDLQPLWEADQVKPHHASRKSNTFLHLY